nr:MAG TPA: hypothetical protein [Caudoviricetes sp.]
MLAGLRPITIGRINPPIQHQRVFEQYAFYWFQHNQ